MRTTDNRNAEDVIEYYEARIEALDREVDRLRDLLAGAEGELREIRSLMCDPAGGVR